MLYFLKNKIFLNQHSSQALRSHLRPWELGGPMHTAILQVRREESWPARSPSTPGWGKGGSDRLLPASQSYFGGSLLGNMEPSQLPPSSAYHETYPEEAGCIPACPRRSTIIHSLIQAVPVTSNPNYSEKDRENRGSKTAWARLLP
jgi:hypothetical protein